MTKHTLTIIGAIEDELNHVRGVFNRISASRGKDAAEAVFWAELDEQSAMALAMARFEMPQAIGDKFHMLAMAILALELQTDNQVSYDD